MHHVWISDMGILIWARTDQESISQILWGAFALPRSNSTWHNCPWILELFTWFDCLLGSNFGCLQPVVSIAAVLSFKDPLVISIQERDWFKSGRKMDERVSIRHDIFCFSSL